MNRTEPVADRIAREARARFPRWDARLWKEILEGPAAELARALDQAGEPVDRSRPALEAYLALAAEAAGLGYLYPRAAGRDNAFSRAWFGWLPQGLAAEPPARRAELLAACWNLAENLERSAPWLQRIFLRRIPEDLSLDRLEESAARVSEELLAAPDAPLGPGFRLHWVHLGATDPLFLPGEIAFLSPTVAAVEDRRPGLDGLPRAAVGVWLSDPPEVLGLVPPQRVELSGEDLGPLGEEAARRDPRVTAVRACARNEWRAACTLETSQFLVVLTPGS